MYLRPMSSHIPWSYIFNEISFPKKYQRVTKIHLSQGRHISCISGTFPKENKTIDIWVFSMKKLI